MLAVPELLWPEKPEAAKLGEEELNHPSGSFWLFRWVLWSSSAQVACASLQVPSVSVPGGGQGWGKNHFHPEEGDKGSRVAPPWCPATFTRCSTHGCTDCHGHILA